MVLETARVAGPREEGGWGHRLALNLGKSVMFQQARFGLELMVGWGLASVVAVNSVGISVLLALEHGSADRAHASQEAGEGLLPCLDERLGSAAREVVSLNLTVRGEIRISRITINWACCSGVMVDVTSCALINEMYSRDVSRSCEASL